MQRLFQPDPRERRPILLQVLAIVCLLVVTVMSTAQVSHTHAEFSALKQGHHNSPAPDDHCPLCVAMHSALAVPQEFAPEPILEMQRLDSVAAEALRLFRWRFEMASRPPPAGSLV
jgi:hypothetical protein